MQREQQDEFQLVRQQALRQLRRAKLYASNRVTRTCKYLVLPSFDNPVAWEVITFRAKKHQSLRLYRTCWRYDVDSEVFRSPVTRLKHPRPYRPTIESGWVEIRSVELHSILVLFTGTSIPLYCDNHHFGCDGTSYELTMGEGFCFTTISWWSYLPKEWEPLEPAVEKLMSLFHQAWARRSPEGQ